MSWSKWFLVSGLFAPWAGCGGQAPAGGRDGAAPPPAPAPASSVASPLPTTVASAECCEPKPHRERQAKRTTPEPCKDHGAAPSGPPTALFDAGDPRAQGTDVSVAQGDVPWRALTDGGLEFVYVRASEGTKIRDSRFDANWAMARACGLPRGAYHVFEPTQDVDDQVATFLEILGDDHGELPAVLDVEISPEMVQRRNEQHGTKDKFPSRAAYLDGVLKWLTKVEARTGKRPMIYIQVWYWHSFLGKSDVLTKHALWAAGSAPRAVDGWAWTFWQHGEPAHWDKRQWDRDRFVGPPADLEAFIQASGAAKSAP